jgi:hypothetical protein
MLGLPTQDTTGAAAMITARRQKRHDQCIRQIVTLELDLFGEVLSASIQDTCQHAESDTFVHMFARPDADGRRGRSYIACLRCRKVLVQL